MIAQPHTTRIRLTQEQPITMARPLAEWMVPYALLGMLATLVVVYVILMNSLTQKAFEMKAVQMRMVSLQQEMKSQEVKIAQYEAIDQIAQQATQLGMVPTTHADVLLRGGVVALR